MSPVQMSLIGCGGMGRRHLKGIAKLNRSLASIGLPPSIDLTVVIDQDPSRATSLADEAEHLLGYRPAVATGIEAALPVASFSAVDICTATESHHIIGSMALELGCDVLIEKPLAPTIRTGRMLVDTANATGRTLAVAENVRREPVNRFAKALIQSGVIGDVRMVIDLVMSGGDAILLTPWRHRRITGGTLLDVGVHTADVIEYLAGPVRALTGNVRLDEPIRYRRHSPVASRDFYEAWVSQIPPKVEADTEDIGLALLDFESGATGQWTINQAAHGQPQAMRLIYGSRGSIQLPADRSGRPPIVVTDDGHRVTDGEVLDLLPEFCLSPIESSIWGGSRIAFSQGTFAEIDEALVAIELQDFAESTTSSVAPEVDGETGLRNMALVYAIFESSTAKRAIDIASVLDGSVSCYQDPIDLELGIL